MNYGFVRVAAVTPSIRVADCAYNAGQIVDAIRSAASKGAELICLPELCITGYTCQDLFLQPTLQRGAEQALRTISEETAALSALIFVGLPCVHQGKLYNCAAVLQSGKLLGVVPKTHLPNYGEFYERRQFTPAPATIGSIILCGQEAPFGVSLLFACTSIPSLCVGVELCEDLWAPLPPSTLHAMAGATVVVNLSASDETIGKAAYRRELVSGQSARLLCGYVYADAGEGESTTDMVFAAHNLIAENGVILAQNKPFSGSDVLSEIDTEKLSNERLRNTTYPAAGGGGYLKILFALPPQDSALLRRCPTAPFVPDATAERESRCETILTMQAHGLKKRIEHTRCDTLILGISGGLDSTLALLVAVRAFELLQKPLAQIVAVTMPCFGTTQRTRSNAETLCRTLGVTLREVNITETVRSNFADIGHDEALHDVTYENTQARVRTLVLMNLANQENGLVVGTGDLSELALGWATYNGDHMSMYGVNASVPKTLIRYLVRYAADTAAAPALKEVLCDILNTPVSPELLPASKNGEISQQTEEIVGPYELHDFFLYYATRWAFGPKKIFFLAQNAFDSVYDDATILKWLKKFYWRFFSQQYKRSCLPDGPKIGSVSLSPRGDWRMPSDAVCALWVKELEMLG